MITKFEEGKYYFYTGKRQPGWNRQGLMDFILERRPHKCVKVGLRPDSAAFEDDPYRNRGERYYWSWGDLTEFHEVGADGKVNWRETIEGIKDDKRI